MRDALPKPAGTYTGQFVMSGYLDLKVSPWARVAITRAVAIAPTLVVALLCGSGSAGSSSSSNVAGGGGGGGLGLLGSLMANGEGSNATSLDQLNQGLNLLQSVQLPFALIPVSGVALWTGFHGGRVSEGLESCGGPVRADVAMAQLWAPLPTVGLLTCGMNTGVCPRS